MRRCCLRNYDAIVEIDAICALTKQRCITCLLEIFLGR